MRSEMFTLTLVCIASLLFCQMGIAGDQLEDAYKEQYEKYTTEIESLKPLIDTYSNCIEKTDNINNQLISLYGKEKRYEISRLDAVNEKIRLNEEGLKVLREGLSTFNASKGEQRSDISIDEIKHELQLSRSRMKELEDKKQELKIKILETKGTLPAWWAK
jgi:hypothetical protein